MFLKLAAWTGLGHHPGMTLRALITLACLWLSSWPVLAAVGTVDSLEGDVRIVSAGRERAAAAGGELNEGDTVKTGDNAWALLAMSDGASLTLRPNTQLRFDTYRYDPDGKASENTSVLALLKGALRSITGYIGRTNRTGYSIATPTATIGIRGTDHEPAYYPPGERTDRDPGTYDKVNDGESFIRNPKGQVAVKRGQYAYVNHLGRTAPGLLKTPPAFYQRHAEFDRKATARRQEFHRKFEEQHRVRMQQRAQRQQQRAGEKGLAQQHDARAKQKEERLEKQRERRELMEKRQQERQAQQQKRKEQLEKDRFERQREHAKKLEEKKRRE